MKRMTQKEIKHMVTLGVAEDITYLSFDACYENGTFKLQSYDTIVSRCINGKVEELGKWSATTTRQKKEFRKQFEY